MPNIISNASGAINATVAITQAMVADQYKLTYNCTNVGDGKSFLLITGDNTYFFPLQFTGQQEVVFNAEFGSLIQCVLHGNASISGLALATNDVLSDSDRQALELVKADSTSWGKIKDIVDENNKLRADKMAGILNMTHNSFANENGTVKQENGIYTWMNGSSYETATEAVRVSGGAIGVSNQKDGNDDWVWRTAITGAGIKADAIATESFDAVEITGAKITAGSIEGTEIKGSDMIGGAFYCMDAQTIAEATKIILMYDGYIFISNRSNTSESFNFKTALSADGINAEVIKAGKVKGLEVEAGKITGGTIIGTEISGSNIISGTLESGTYIKIDKLGNIHGYRNSVKVFSIDIYNKTYPEIRMGQNLNSGYSPDLTIGQTYNVTTGQTEFNIMAHASPLNINSTGRIAITSGMSLDITAPEIHFYGNVYDRNGIQRFTKTE